jgi:hypothetical protein
MTGHLKVFQTDDRLRIVVYRYRDPDSTATGDNLIPFAECPVAVKPKEDITPYVDAVIDSSRYYVLRYGWLCVCVCVCVLCSLCSVFLWDDSLSFSTLPFICWRRPDVAARRAYLCYMRAYIYIYMLYACLYICTLYACRIKDPTHATRSAIIGIGFRERDTALDFKHILNEYVRYVDRMAQAEQLAAQYVSVCVCVRAQWLA